MKQGGKRWLVDSVCRLSVERESKGRKQKDEAGQGIYGRVQSNGQSTLCTVISRGGNEEKREERKGSVVWVVLPETDPRGNIGGIF